MGLLLEGFEISWFGEWHRNKCGHPVHRTTPKLILNKTTIKEEILKIPGVKATVNQIHITGQTAESAAAVVATL